MDGQPEDADPFPVAERAQWERLRRVSEEHEAQEAEDRRQDAERAAEAERLAEAGRVADASQRDRTSIRLGVVAAVVAVVFIVGAGVLLVVIRHRSTEQPAWVAQLGLEKGSSAGDQAPSRLSGGTTGDTAASSGGAPLSSTSTSTTDPNLAAAPPSIVTTGEDLDLVWRQIETFEGWLLMHPDPARVVEIYEPGTTASDDLTRLLRQLQTDHQTLQVESYRILGVSVVGRPSPDRADLRYADTYTRRITTDTATGAVVRTEPYDGRARLWTLTLQRGADGRWRLVDTAFVSFGDVVPPD